MTNQAPKLKRNVLWALIIFGLFGQIAWTIENMYFNLFLYKTVDATQSGINAIAVMVAASAVTATLTTLLMGALSDKLGKRKVFIVAGYLVWGVVIMSFAFITKTNIAKVLFGGELAADSARVVAATVAVVVVLDCLMTFFGSTANDAAFNAWVTDVTVPENRGKAEGILSALPLLAMLIVFGGFDSLTQNGMWTAFFLIIGGMVILGGLAGLFIIKDNCVRHEGNANYFRNIIYGFRPSVIKNNKPLYTALIAMGIFCTAEQVFMPYLMIYFEFFLKIENYTIILALVLVAAAVFSILMGKPVDKYGKHKFLYLSAVVFIFGLFMMYFHGMYLTSNKAVSMVFLGIFGSVMMGGYLLLTLIINAAARDYMPEQQRGHYNGIRMIFFVLIPMVIGPAIGSAIISGNKETYIDPTYGTEGILPTPDLFLWSGLIALLVFIPIFFIVRDMKRKLPNEKLYTRWGRKLDKGSPLPEYPRPQLVRGSYINLNGVWQYAIYKKEESFGGYQGEIVVPYSPETLLSGVSKPVTPLDKLYYKRVFEVPKGFLSDKTLLHFGAVDYECAVAVNGRAMGSHRGGFTPFTLDITEAVKAGANEITLEVTDPTDRGWGSRGKQSTKPGGIWYTPQSGIWQTVWLESVPKDYIEKVRFTPDIDRGVVRINPTVSGKAAKVGAKISFKGKTVAETELKANADNEIAVGAAHLWSPEEPNLYDIELTAGKDKVTSYFGMRKFSIGKDGEGIARLMLNNKPYFHNGLLDQGYWPDGMLTPPSYEAMLFDIKKMKGLGFNMLRKHIKIEPLRWYYYCDREGMLVWQDMVNGGRKYGFLTTALLPAFKLEQKDTERNYKKFARQDKEGREEYFRELDGTIDWLFNAVALCVWVPFNEGWGQFDALKTAEFIRARDNSRLIDHASGWHDQGGGDLKSLHIYFRPVTLPKPEENRALALTEFGGYSLGIEGHVFNKNRVFGYRVFKNPDGFKKAYAALYNKQILPKIAQGLSAAVYTQLSDVEDETNGILTYDREVCKLDNSEVTEINKKLKL